MRKADLKAALLEYYNSYEFCQFDSSVAEEVLNTRVVNYHGKKKTVLSKIAREEKFTSKETIAFRADIEKFDVESLITIIKNHNYEFHPNVDDYENLGDVLREQLVDCGLPKWIMKFIDYEQLGFDHISNANECLFRIRLC